MKLTDEQISCVDSFKRNDRLVVNALAGTGKTTTLIELSKSAKGRGVYLAFNRSIANEVKDKNNNRDLKCATTHSLAFRWVMSKYSFSTDQMLTSPGDFLIERHLDLSTVSIKNIVSLTVRQQCFLVSQTISNFCYSSDTTPEAKHVPKLGVLNILDQETLAKFRTYVGECAQYIWGQMADPDLDFSLGHDGYLKLWSLECSELPFDYLLLDEAQDTNDCVLSILARQPLKSAFVGDKYQQIYEWRGAANALDKIDADKIEYLTRTFRFGNSLANYANRILQDLGCQYEIKSSQNVKTTINVAKAYCHISRTNSGVLTNVMMFLRDNKKVAVLGGTAELEKQLKDVARLKNGEPAFSQELFGFQSWEQVQLFARQEEGSRLFSFVDIVEKFGEQTLLSGLEKVLTEQSRHDVLLTTAHKAKGREWDSIELDSDFSTKDGEDEEKRLLYVALTRARRNLNVGGKLLAYLNSDPDSKIECSPKNDHVVNINSQPEPQVQPKRPRPTTPSFVKRG